MRPRLWRDTANPYVCALCEALIFQKTRADIRPSGVSNGLLPSVWQLPRLLAKCRRWSLPVRTSRALLHSGRTRRTPSPPPTKQVASHGSDWDNLLLPEERSSGGAQTQQIQPAREPAREASHANTSDSPSTTKKKGKKKNQRKQDQNDLASKSTPSPASPSSSRRPKRSSFKFTKKLKLVWQALVRKIVRTWRAILRSGSNRGLSLYKLWKNLVGTRPSGMPAPAFPAKSSKGKPALRLGIADLATLEGKLGAIEQEVALLLSNTFVPVPPPRRAVFVPPPYSPHLSSRHPLLEETAKTRTSPDGQIQAEQLPLRMTQPSPLDTRPIGMKIYELTNPGHTASAQPFQSAPSRLLELAKEFKVSQSHIRRQKWHQQQHQSSVVVKPVKHSASRTAHRNPNENPALQSHGGPGSVSRGFGPLFGDEFLLPHEVAAREALAKGQSAAPEIGDTDESVPVTHELSREGREHAVAGTAHDPPAEMEYPPETEEINTLTGAPAFSEPRTELSGQQPTLSTRVAPLPRAGEPDVQTLTRHPALQGGGDHLDNYTRRRLPKLSKPRAAPGSVPWTSFTEAHVPASGGTRRSAVVDDILLPHERAAREIMKAPPAPTDSPDPSSSSAALPRDTSSHDPTDRKPGQEMHETPVAPSTWPRALGEFVSGQRKSLKELVDENRAHSLQRRQLLVRTEALTALSPENSAGPVVAKISPRPAPVHHPHGQHIRPRDSSPNVAEDNLGDLLLPHEIAAREALGESRAGSEQPVDPSAGAPSEVPVSPPDISPWGHTQPQDRGPTPTLAASRVRDPTMHAQSTAPRAPSMKPFGSPWGSLGTRDGLLPSEAAARDVMRQTATHPPPLPASRWGDAAVGRGRSRQFDNLLKWTSQLGDEQSGSASGALSRPSSPALRNPRDDFYDDRRPRHRPDADGKVHPGARAPPPDGPSQLLQIPPKQKNPVIPIDKETENAFIEKFASRMMASSKKPPAASWTGSREPSWSYPPIEDPALKPPTYRYGPSSVQRGAEVSSSSLAQADRNLTPGVYSDTMRRQWTSGTETASGELGPAVSAPEESVGEWDKYGVEMNRRRQGRGRDYQEGRGARFEAFEEPDAYGKPERSKKASKDKKKKKQSHGGEQEDDWEDDWEERQERRREKRRWKEEQVVLEQVAPKVPQISIPEFIAVEDLARALSLDPEEMARALVEFGFESLTTKSVLTGETAALVAQEYGFEATVESGEDRDLKPRPPPDDPFSLPERPPVVTIMGHVDHGKTTMLDFLRKSSVAAQEHGGITQHIGAFVVQLSSGKHITFLDTPGHAAFLAMRQRGANATDIVVLVVAADDSVMPQTIEALGHAKAANVPIIVAINKVDKPGARVEAVKADLARQGIEIEDYGGDVQVVCTSGRTGQGMAELEETIVTLSEVLDLRAEPDGMAEGWVIESSIKQVGKSAVVLVKRGTIRVGDVIVAGTSWARIRALRNEAGDEIDEAGPGAPAEVLGWGDSLPDAGDEMIQAPDEGRARAAITYREEMRERESNIDEASKQEKRRLEEDASRAAAKDRAESQDAEPEKQESSGPKVVHFIVKADVAGSAEAVCGAILEMGNNEVQPKILRSGAGAITEWDVEHAAISGSTIVNFNSPVSSAIRSLATKQAVTIMEHTIIYHLSDAVKQILSTHLADKVSYRVTGEAEILQVFPINIRGRMFKNIAGCRIRNGAVHKGSLVRVIRGGQRIFEGKVDSMKHGKKDIGEMSKGSECGIGVAEFEDYQVGDLIQTIEEIRESRSL